MNYSISKRYNEVFDWFQNAFRARIKIEEKLSAWQWMEKHIVLSEKSAANAGTYDFDHTPVWKTPVDWLEDPEVRQITVVKGVQVGGTTWMVNCELYNAAVLKLPMLHVGQTETDVKKYLKAKFLPSMLECGPLEGKLKAGTAWNEKEFEGCFFDLGWGSSANSVASMSKGFVCADETDKYKQADKADIHPYAGVKQRVEGFPDTYKFLATSTPTIESGEIWKEYLSGSQSVYHVACPCCDHRQELHFSEHTLKWDQDAKGEDDEWDLGRVEESAYYQCQNDECKHPITEYERRDIINWRKLTIVDKNPKAPRWHKSLHVSGFYSNDLSLGKIAVKFLQLHKTPNGLKTFTTQVLGLPFVQQAIKNDAGTIRKLQEKSPIYHRAKREKDHVTELPFDTLYIATTVDVQGDHYWIMQMAFTRDGNCAILDWGKVFGYAEVLAWRARRYTHLGNAITKRFSFIDSGFDTKTTGGVYQFVIRNPGKFLPCVGRDNKLFEVVQAKTQKFRGREFELYSFQDPYFKELTYQHRMRGFSAEALWLPVTLDNELIAQITDEQLINKQTINGAVMKWEAKNDNNHLGDCLKMGYVIWEHIAAALLENKK